MWLRQVLASRFVANAVGCFYVVVGAVQFWDELGWGVLDLVSV